jgi:ATP-binding protein involved in chromosome partitioning
MRGVGKSTVATNLVTLAKWALKLGLLDAADIYGPSVPIMFDVAQNLARKRKWSKIKNEACRVMGKITFYWVFHAT